MPSNDPPKGHDELELLACGCRFEVRLFRISFESNLVEGHIPPDSEVYLKSLNMNLTGDAEEWAESYPDAVYLLEDPLLNCSALLDSIKTNEKNWWEKLNGYLYTVTVFWSKLASLKRKVEKRKETQKRITAGGFSYRKECNASCV